MMLMLIAGHHEHFGTKNVHWVMLWAPVSIGSQMMMMTRILILVLIASKSDFCLAGLPVELLHCSFGDKLSDGGRKVAGCANNIIA
jgi:hypothetical protein